MHTASRLLAPSRAFPRLLLLTLFALFALSALITARPAQAADTTPPTITNAKISPTGTYSAGATLPTITVTATVTDNAGGTGIDPNRGVYAYIQRYGVNFVRLPLTKGSGNTYAGTFNLSGDGSNTGHTNRVYTAQVNASDNSGNTAASVNATGSITQTFDSTPPVITNAKITPSSGTYGAAATLPVITITCMVTDNAGGTGVNSRIVEATVFVNGSYGSHIYYLSKGSGNTYSATFDLNRFGTNTTKSNRVFTVGSLEASDLSGNTAASVNAAGSITQTPPPAPKLSNAAVTPNIILNGGATVTLKVSATPGVFRTISTVRAEVYEDGTDLGYSDLNNTTGSTYSITRDLPAGDSTPHLYKFVFSATDNVGNVSSVTRYAQQAGTNTLPAPTLTAISPATGYTNTGVTLTLTGTNFTPSSVVLFDGFIVPGTYKSATSLTCAVDKSFLPAVKQVNVQVYNPKPAGGTSGSKTFTINPTLSSLSLSPTSVTAGGTSTGTVTLSATSPNAQTVMLTSSNAAAVVPASVVVPAGQKTATFTVTTGTVTASTSVTISAKLGATKTTTLTVTAPVGVTVQSLTLSPTSVKGGAATSTGTITLTGPAPAGGLAVTQTSSNTAATLAGTVNIPAGATSAKFKITTYAVPTNKTVTITSTANGVSKTATLTVTP